MLLGLEFKDKVYEEFISTALFCYRAVIENSLKFFFVHENCLDSFKMIHQNKFFSLYLNYLLYFRNIQVKIIFIKLFIYKS